MKKDQTSGSTYDRLYWYNLSLDPLAESDLSGTLTDEYTFFNGKRIARRIESGGAVNYYFSDHLGTSRVVTNSSGTILDDTDFLPYGKERGSSSSGNRYKFTGKERDGESGLDDFGARHYSNWMGRFISPDEPFADQYESDPQSWNLYSYVRNNPLIFTDPTGRCKKGDDDRYHDSEDGPCVEEKGTSITVYANKDDLRLDALRQAGIYAFDLSAPREGLKTSISITNRVGAALVALGQCVLGSCSKADVAMATIPSVGRLGNAGRILPRSARTFKAAAEAFKHLEKYHGIGQVLASERLHRIKAAAGLGPADNVLIDRTGGVWNHMTREFLGSLTEGGKRALP